MQLTLLVIGKDAADCTRFDISGIDCDLRIVANVASEGLAAIANRHLDTSEEVFGLVHADTIFRPGALAAFVAAAESGAVCGIVGRSLDGVYRWCFQKPGPVCTLDGCSVFFRRDSGLRFDSATFDSFHCHVEDLCMQASERGIPVIVPPADATHASEIPSPAWRAHYMPYRKRLTKKWQHRQLITT